MLVPRSLVVGRAPWRVTVALSIYKIMDYIYTIIYLFEGISDTSLVEDKIVYQDNTPGITVLLTKDI